MLCSDMRRSLPTYQRVPFMLADIASAFVLYKFSSKLWNNEIGVVVAGFVCFCRLFFFGSAMWGSVITLIVPLMLATLYFILTKRNLFAVLAYCVACLCAKEAIVFFPALVIYYAYALVMALIKGRGKDRNELDYNNPVFVPLYAVIAFFLGYLISLPYLKEKVFYRVHFLFYYHLNLPPKLISTLYLYKT